MSPVLEGRPLLDELVSKGIRLTAQRRALIEVIQEARDHLDAGSLLELARKREPIIDRATVYRTIDLLKKSRCVRIEEYTSPLFDQLKAEISHEAGVAIRVTRLEVGGSCRVCGGGDPSTGQEETESNATPNR